MAMIFTSLGLVMISVECLKLICIKIIDNYN